MKYLFVYGTLMRGLPLNNILVEKLNARYLCEGVLKEHCLYGDLVPHLKCGDINERVKGEVWVIEEEDFNKYISYLDGVEKGYSRNEVWVFTERGLMECMVYFSDIWYTWLRKIKGGDYRKYFNKVVMRRNGS